MNCGQIISILTDIRDQLTDLNKNIDTMTRYGSDSISDISGKLEDIESFLEDINSLLGTIDMTIMMKD